MPHLAMPHLAGPNNTSKPLNIKASKKRADGMGRKVKITNPEGERIGVRNGCPFSEATLFEMGFNAEFPVNTKQTMVSLAVNTKQTMVSTLAVRNRFRNPQYLKHWTICWAVPGQETPGSETQTWDCNTWPWVKI